MEGNIADVRCRECGAPAKYNIIKQQYLCSYCGGVTEVSEAQKEKQGFRSIVQSRIRKSAEHTRLFQASCSGCGAVILFEEGEAMADCAFCGRALVRKTYLFDEDLPEMIIPFRISKDEAMDCLDDWCRKNRGKKEAKALLKNKDQLQGFYLPYELVRGPVDCTVSRMDGLRDYHCSGYIDRVFVNASEQLDNRLLDAMEPYDLDALNEFAFSYAAGQRVKIRDIDDRELEKRTDAEVSEDYAPLVRRTLETEKISVEPYIDRALHMPVLLPAYVICSMQCKAAVNGQTGKVSVLAQDPSHYYFIPWWAKAILAALAISAIAFGSFCLFGMKMEESLYITGMLGLTILIITLCAYSDSVKNSFRVETERKIFTSSPLYKRENGMLVKEDKNLEVPSQPPVFFEKIEGTVRPVQLVFSSPLRMIQMILLALTVLFLPVIVALFLNGFDFKRLELGGSAVWFCIMVPVVPIYLLKFGSIEFYEHPWIYMIHEDGSKTRYHKKIEIDWKQFLSSAAHLLFVPPVSFAVWFGILSFCVMCWLTAFGFQ